MSRTPTAQQKACVQALMDGVPMLKVEACAGSGKTSTLVMMAEAAVKPSLYLAFNKVTAMEAEAKFPSHVRAQTTHSKAYAAYGARMRDKLFRPKGKYVNVAGTGSEIARFFGIAPYQNHDNVTISAPYIGLLVKETVARFEQSADNSLVLDHVPFFELKKKLNDDVVSTLSVRKLILKFAKELWKERIKESSCVLATHDTYLKLFQLSKPIFEGVEVLYVDEFQDTTPCVLDIIMNQAKHMQVVMVGDARQAIYGFRGAVNAMQLVRCPSRGLTKSFRYGQNIASIATEVLEGAMDIEGNDSISSETGLVGIVVRTEPYTRLFRTNSALLCEAILEIEKGTQVSIEIDVKEFVRLLQSGLALCVGDKKNVKHEKVVPFSDWKEMALEGDSDPELGRLCRIIKEGKAAHWCNALENHKNSDNPHITFTTAHKSKGREWAQVIVENDFKSNYNESGKWVGLSDDEQNLLYVAVTRAIHRLEYNQTVQEYLVKSTADSVE